MGQYAVLVADVSALVCREFPNRAPVRSWTEFNEDADPVRTLRRKRRSEKECHCQKKDQSNARIHERPPVKISAEGNLLPSEGM